MMRNTMRAISPICLATAVLIASGPAQADLTDIRRDECAIRGEYAEMIMAARQDGIALDDLLGVLEQSDYFELWELMAVMAYRNPRRSSEAGRAEVVSDFRDLIQVDCLERGLN